MILECFFHFANLFHWACVSRSTISTCGRSGSVQSKALSSGQRIPWFDSGPPKRIYDEPSHHRCERLPCYSETEFGKSWGKSANSGGPCNSGGKWQDGSSFDDGPVSQRKDTELASQRSIDEATEKILWRVIPGVYTEAAAPATWTARGSKLYGHMATSSCRKSPQLVHIRSCLAASVGSLSWVDPHAALGSFSAAWLIDAAGIGQMPQAHAFIQLDLDLLRVWRIVCRHELQRSWGRSDC